MINGTLPILASAFALISAFTCQAEQRLISIDGVSGDWIGAEPAYEDLAGDGGSSGIDLGRVWMADDDRFLFLRFELGAEASLQENNDLRLYLDTDGNSETGLPVNGIGAELEWRFGDRVGTFRHEGRATTVRYHDIRFRAAPSVTSSVFEVAIGRDTSPDGENPLFFGSDVRIVLGDASDGDQLPNPGEILSYTFDQGQLPSETDVPIVRDEPDDLRIATYNVHYDSPWDPILEERFERLLAAAAPDIINFQEIYDHGAAETLALVETWLPPNPGENWHAAGNHDCQTVSRYPLIGSCSLDDNLAVLIDTTSAWRSELLIINAHLPCCAFHEERQVEIDRIMAFIRDSQQGGGPLGLAPDTPILITGDLNLIGPARQLATLLSGDIVNQADFGLDFAPDWNGTNLTNLPSRQTEKRMGYTWRSDSSTYWPAHLDYFVYTDSVLTVANHFLLYTPQMSALNLAAYGLLADDSLASDHLLFCADFRSRAPYPGDFDGNGTVDLADYTFFVRCLAGPGVSPCPTPPVTVWTCRRAFDLDVDDDVDLRDFARFALISGTT